MTEEGKLSVIRILTDKRVLKALLILQVASCVLVQKEIFIGDLVVRLMMLGFVSLSFWCNLTLALRYVEKAKRTRETRGNFYTRMLMSKGAGCVFIVIVLCVYTILFFLYVINFFPWIISHMLRVTRILALVILLRYLSVLIIYTRNKRREGEKVFSADNMNTTGLIIQNLLFAMTLFVY